MANESDRKIPIRDIEDARLPPGEDLPISSVQVNYIRYDQATQRQYVEVVNRSGQTARIYTYIAKDGAYAGGGGYWDQVPNGGARYEDYRPLDYGFGTISYVVARVIAQ